MSTVNIDILVNSSAAANSIGELKKSVRELKSALVSVEEGSMEFNKLNEAAGKAKDKLDDINQAIKAQTGEPIQRVTGSLSLMGAKLSELDFKGATAALKSFSTNLTAMPFGEVANGAKAFSVTMVEMGASLLLNPLFLIPAALAAIGVALYAIAEDTKKSVQDQIEAYDRLSSKIDKVYDRRIAQAKALGETDRKSETDKLAIELAITNKQIKDLEILQANYLTSSKEQAKQLDDLQQKRLDIRSAQTILSNEQIKEAQDATAKNIAAAEGYEKKDLAIKETIATENKKNWDDAVKEAESASDKLAAIDTKAADDKLKLVKKLKDDVRNAEITSNAQAQVDGAAMVDAEDQRQVDLANIEILKNGNTLTNQKTLLEAKMAQELDNVNLTETQKELIKEQYRERERQLEYAAIQEKIGYAQMGNQSMIDLANIYFTFKAANLKKGSAEEVAAAKQQFNIKKTLGIVSAVISTAEAIAKANSLGYPMAIPAMIAAGISGTAQIVSIASQQFNSGASGTAAAVVPAATATTTSGPNPTSAPTIPSFDMFNSTGEGKSNNVSNSDSNKQNITVKAVVIAQEVTDSQTLTNYSNNMGSL